MIQVTVDVPPGTNVVWERADQGSKTLQVEATFPDDKKSNIFQNAQLIITKSGERFILAVVATERWSGN